MTFHTRPASVPLSNWTIWYKRLTPEEPLTRFWIGDGPSPNR